jgi:phosphoribosyl-ATP pyrophosphohydrolase
MSTSNDTLARLADVIEARRKGDPDKSYVARLFHKGTDAILKKIGEEATETVMAAKDGDAAKLVHEVADLGSTDAGAAALGVKPATCWLNWSGARACPGWRNSRRAR